MLRLHVDRRLIPHGRKHCILLYPFFGDLDTDATSPDYGRFAAYGAVAATLFTIVEDPAACDVVLMPFDFAFDDDSRRVAHTLGQLAARHGRKLLIFCNHDNDQPIDVPNAIVFRTSVIPGQARPNEFGFPAWSSDMLRALAPGWQPDTTVPDHPSVSYCGYLDYLDACERFSWARLSTLVGQYARGRGGLRYVVGPRLRGRAVRALRRAGVATNILRRDGFWAPGVSPQLARHEFFTNLMSAPYALVVRGAGNFSYRLYEAISCGRIPLYVDTGSLLPFARQIDWDRILVKVPVHAIDQAADIVRTHHRQLNTEAYRDLQLRVRTIYTDWLSPVVFFSRLHQCL